MAQSILPSIGPTPSPSPTPSIETILSTQLDEQKYQEELTRAAVALQEEQRQNAILRQAHRESVTSAMEASKQATNAYQTATRKAAIDQAVVETTASNAELKKKVALNEIWSGPGGEALFNDLMTQRVATEKEIAANEAELNRISESSYTGVDIIDAVIKEHISLPVRSRNKTDVARLNRIDASINNTGAAMTTASSIQEQIKMSITQDSIAANERKLANVAEANAQAAELELLKSNRQGIAMMMQMDEADLQQSNSYYNMIKDMGVVRRQSLEEERARLLLDEAKKDIAAEESVSKLLDLGAQLRGESALAPDYKRRLIKNPKEAAADPRYMKLLKAGTSGVIAGSPYEAYELQISTGKLVNDTQNKIIMEIAASTPNKDKEGIKDATTVWMTNNYRHIKPGDTDNPFGSRALAAMGDQAAVAKTTTWQVLKSAVEAGQIKNHQDYIDYVTPRLGKEIPMEDFYKDTRVIYTAIADYNNKEAGFENIGLDPQVNFFADITTHTAPTTGLFGVVSSLSSNVSEVDLMNDTAIRKLGNKIIIARGEK